MKRFIGTFYFEKTINGNLIGEFTNNDSDIVIPECAQITNHPNEFEGIYLSCWYDIDLCQAELEIIKMINKFKVKWTTTKGDDFIGEGFLTGKKLIGYYEKKPK